MTVFFYDSYAVIEYINNNSRFAHYFEENTGILTIFNLVEIYYAVLNHAGKEKADLVFEFLFPITVEPSKETIKEAMRFRWEQKKMKLSYADSIGYKMASERKILFLTGDSQFKDMENVIFIK